MMEEDKVELIRRRAKLVGSLPTLTSNEDRVRVQGELSVVNAKIKALNTTEAARLKAIADRRRAAGLAEAQANAARAGGKDNGARSWDEEEDDDPGQTAAIDGWIDAVLLRHDVLFTRTATGKLSIVGSPGWAPVVGMLIEGIYAAARGQELPPLPPAPTPTKSSKHKNR